MGMRIIAAVVGAFSLVVGLIAFVLGVTVFAMVPDEPGTLFVIASGLGCTFFGSIIVMLTSIDDRLEEAAKWAARERAAVKARAEEEAA